MSIRSVRPAAMAAVCHSSTDVHEVKVGSRSAAVSANSEMLAAALISARQRGDGETGSIEVAGDVETVVGDSIVVAVTVVVAAVAVVVDAAVVVGAKVVAGAAVSLSSSGSVKTPTRMKSAKRGIIIALRLYHGRFPPLDEDLSIGVSEARDLSDAGALPAFCRPSS